MAFGAGAIVKGSPSDLPLANSASARRSAVVRPCVIETIDPNSRTSRMCCGLILRSTSKPGARSTARL